MPSDPPLQESRAAAASAVDRLRRELLASYRPEALQCPEVAAAVTRLSAVSRERRLGGQPWPNENQ